MGYIKEPAGINFVVDPTPITANDRKKLSEIIAYYKITGKKMPIQKTTRIPNFRKAASSVSLKKQVLTN